MRSPVLASFFSCLRCLLPQQRLGQPVSKCPLSHFGRAKGIPVFLTQAGHLKVDWLELRLVCEEEVSFSDGTDIRTETARVYDEVVFRKEDFEILPYEPFQHECPLAVPPLAMHSFLSTHNAVVWNLLVRVNAKKWPMFERIFPLVLYPEDAKTF